MRKPRGPEQGQQEVRRGDYAQVLGLDPGRKDLFVTCNLDGEHQHLTTRRFYDEACYKASQRTMQGWLDRNPLARQVQEGLPTWKTSRLEALRQHVVFLLPRLEQMLQFHMDKPFRKLKLRRFIGAKKALNRICRQLTAGRRTLVGFGDWSNTDTGGLIKKSPAGPVKGLERELRKHCRVVPVDEYRTSKVCNRCGRKLEHRRSNRHRGDGVVQENVRIHKVLYCANSSCTSTTVDRDENASRNIRDLLLRSVQHLPRPPHFCRGVRLDDGMAAPF